MEQRKLQVIGSPNYRLDFRGFIDSGDYLHLSVDKTGRIRELLSRSPLTDRFEFVEADEAKEEDLLLVHSRGYLLSLRIDPRKVLGYFEIGSNVLEGEDAFLFTYVNYQLLRPMRYIVSGTIQAGISSLERRVAVNLGGGYHHASSDNGGGFCVYNDVAVAIRYLQREGLAKKVLIVDLDVHHGDGNARIFKKDQDVFVFSMHEGDIFPPKKPKSDFDIKLKELTGDDRYMYLLRTHLPVILDRFKPDVIFYLAGADVYRGDRSSNLNITRKGILERDVFAA